MVNKSTEQRQNDAKDESAQVGWMSAMGSSVAAAFGVQSHKNRVRDFQSGDIRKFVVTGLVLTFTILFSLIAVVRVVLSGV